MMFIFCFNFFIPWLLESPLQLVLHHVDELLVAEAAVAVLVKDGEDDVDDVIREVDVGTNLGRTYIR